MAGQRFFRSPGKGALFWALLLSLAWSPASFGEAGPGQEGKLKAAFLVNFIRFMSWPETTFANGQEPLQLCIVGADPFGRELDRAEGKTIGGRLLAVRYGLQEGELTTCQMVYCSRQHEWDWSGLRERLAGSTTVAVSDVPDFVGLGGSIEFVERNGRLAFVINHSDLKRRGVEVSSAMLELAVELR